MTKHMNGLKKCSNDGTYPRHKEVKIGKLIPVKPHHVIFCPTCGRQTMPAVSVRDAKNEWNYDRVFDGNKS